MQPLPPMNGFGGLVVALLVDLLRLALAVAADHAVERLAAAVAIDLGAGGVSTSTSV